MLALNLIDINKGEIYNPDILLHPYCRNKEDIGIYNSKSHKLLQWKLKYLYNNGKPLIEEKEVEFLNERYILKQLKLPDDIPDEIKQIQKEIKQNTREIISELISKKLYSDIDYQVAVFLLLNNYGKEIKNIDKNNIEYLFKLPFKQYFKQASLLLKQGILTNTDLDNIVIKKTSKYYYNEKLPTPYIPLLAREHVYTPDGNPRSPKLGQLYYLYHEVDNIVNLLLSKRQYGKSILTTLIAFQHLMMDGENSILYIVESENKILPIMQYFTIGLKKYSKAGIFTMSKNDFTITCKITGNVLKFMSAGARTGVKGYSFKKVIADEADFISDEVFYSLIPIFNKPGGKFYAVSTVSFDTKGTSTWFYDLAKDLALGLNKMLGQVKGQSITVTLYEDEAVTEEQRSMFELIRKRNPARFLGDYMCIRGEDDKLFDKHKLISPIHSDEYKNNSNIIQCIYGYDPAKKGDYGGLVISYIIQKEDGEVFIAPVDEVLFERLDYFQQIQEVKNRLSIQKIKGIPISIILDTTGIGEAVYEMLAKEIIDVPIYKILYTAGNQVTYKNGTYYVPKKDLIDSVLTLGTQGKIKVPFNLNELITQLDTYRNINGKYEAIAGMHDDVIEAFMNTVFLFKKEVEKKINFINMTGGEYKKGLRIITNTKALNRHKKFLY